MAGNAGFVAGQRSANACGAGDPQLYETQAPVIAALLAGDAYFGRRRTVWEPACGPGAIVRVLQDCGHTVIASDKFDYSDRWRGLPDALPFPAWGWDFFDMPCAPARCDCLITNPPYNDGEGRDLSAAFILRALELIERVYVYLPLMKLQGGADNPARDRVIDRHLTGLFPMRERDTMHRDGWQGRRAGGSIATAWFRFDAEPAGPFRFLRLTSKGGGHAQTR